MDSDSGLRNEMVRVLLKKIFEPKIVKKNSTVGGHSFSPFLSQLSGLVG